MLSLTAHGFNDEFERIKFILAAVPMEGPHTGDNIRSHLLQQFNKWKITEHQCHMIICDNAASMKMAMRLQEWEAFGCLAHTLALIVTGALKVDRSVENLLTNCRSIVAHFNHSSGEYYLIQFSFKLIIYAIPLYTARITNLFFP